MILRLRTIQKQKKIVGFTLAEILIALGIFGLVASGVIFGYGQSNRMAEWSALSFAAQSYAAQGAEQARAADWRPRDYPLLTGPNTMDELPATNSGPVWVQSDIMDVPIKGDPSASDFSFFITNRIYVTTITVNPPLRQIRSDAEWTFYVTGQKYTNTIILLRAPDQ